MREPSTRPNRRIIHQPFTKRMDAFAYPRKNIIQKSMSLYHNTKLTQSTRDEIAFAKNSKSILNRLIIREKLCQKNQAAKQTEKNKLSKLIDRIDDRADQVDTTLTAISYGIMAITTMWANIAPFLMNTLNSIPWISCVLNILNGLFRVTHSLLLKSLKKEGHEVTTRTEVKRALLALLGVASMALGLASMFSIAASIALTIACAAIDFAYSLVPLVIAIYRCFKPDPAKPDRDDADTVDANGNNRRSFEVKRMLGKLEYSVLTALILVGSILLFMPPFMPIGFGILIGTAIYGILDRFDKNPFKNLFELVKNKIRGEKNKNSDGEKTHQELENVASDKNKNSTRFMHEVLTEKETPGETPHSTPTPPQTESLFEKFYCQPKPETQPMNEKPVYYDRKHYAHFLKHPELFKNEDYSRARLR